MPHSYVTWLIQMWHASYIYDTAQYLWHNSFIYDMIHSQVRILRACKHTFCAVCTDHVIAVRHGGKVTCPLCRKGVCVCLCGLMYICIHVQMCVYVYTYIYVYMYAYIYMFCMHLYVCMYIYVYVYAYMYTHKHSYSSSYEGRVSLHSTHFRHTTIIPAYYCTLLKSLQITHMSDDVHLIFTTGMSVSLKIARFSANEAYLCTLSAHYYTYLFTLLHITTHLSSHYCTLHIPLTTTHFRVASEEWVVVSSEWWAVSSE